MVATVIQHVGPYKTGTTALQAFSTNVALLARHGILYPQTGRDGANHAVLAEALLRGEKSKLAELAREARRKTGQSTAGCAARLALNPVSAGREKDGLDRICLFMTSMS